MYDSVSKSFRTGRLARELQMVQLSACLPLGAIVSLFVGQSSDFCYHNLLCCFSRVFIVVSAYLVIDSIRKRLDTPS